MVEYSVIDHFLRLWLADFVGLTPWKNANDLSGIKLSALNRIVVEAGTLRGERSYWRAFFNEDTAAGQYFEKFVIGFQEEKGWSNLDLDAAVVACAEQRASDNSHFVAHEKGTPATAEIIRHQRQNLLDDVALLGTSNGFTRDDWWNIPKLFFVFVESVEHLRSATARGRRSTERMQVRFSAISIEDFFYLIRHVDRIDTDDVVPAQRELRLEQLRTYLTDMPLPILDIVLSRRVRGLGRAQFRLGSWWLLGVRKEDQSPDRCEVAMSFPERSEEVEGLGGLGLLVRPPPLWRDALRDIFSLAHIHDLGLDRPNAIPAPPLPPAPAPGQASRPGDDAQAQSTQFSPLNHRMESL